MLILYESRRGFTLTVAHAIRDEVRSKGHDATTAPIRSVDAGTLAAADALIVGSWVQGRIIVGVGPAEGALVGVAGLPHLDGCPTAVFCTYDVAPRGTLDVLGARLAARGANVSVGEVFRRTRRGPRRLERVPGFVEEALRAFTIAGKAA